MARVSNGPERQTESLPRVGLNAHLLSHSEGYRSAGISRYIRGLLTHLPYVDPTLSYHAFVGDSQIRYPGWEMRVSHSNTASPPLRIVWEQAAQPRASRRERLALLHAPAYVGPIRSSCPFIVTIHDLSFYLYPEWFRPFNRIYLQQFTRWSVERAAHVIADSASTRDDIVRVLGMPRDRISVVYPGIEEEMRPQERPEEIDALRRRYALSAKVILFLGTIEPRKNVSTLLEAYALLCARTDFAHQLVIAGGKGWYYQEVYRRMEELGLRGRICFVGYVPESDLSLWYGAADLFVYPSLYEGFGFPPLEAMACGTPVIVSNTSSLPEVVGDAGLTVDPRDPVALADAIWDVVCDPERRDSLRAMGRARAKMFSWRATAAQTSQLYHQVLGGKGAFHA